MLDEQPTTTLVIRLATPDDITYIEALDGFATSPTRDIHRDMEKYFGSVDPSTHERTFIFLLEMNGAVVAKAELMVPPGDVSSATGYIKRVVSHPDIRGKGLSKQLLQHIIKFAQDKLELAALDLHVWDQNAPAIRLYESLGFHLKHRELYYRLPL